MLKKRVSDIVLFLISSLALTLAILSYFDKPKIGYVHNDILFKKFDGLIEGQQELKAKNNVWQSNLDSLTFDFNRQAQQYSSSRESMSNEEQMLKERQLAEQEKNIMLYKKSIEQKSMEEEQRIQTSVINQVNAYSKDFGKTQGYDYIFGVTENGSILYGNSADDVTEEVVEYINAKYKGN